MANYRGSLVVNEEEQTEGDAESCCYVVADEAVEDDVEGGAPDSYSQEEKVAKEVKVDVSVPVWGRAVVSLAS